MSILKITAPQPDWIPLSKGPFVFQKMYFDVPTEPIDYDQFGEGCELFELYEQRLILAGAKTAHINIETGTFEIFHPAIKIDAHPALLIEYQRCGQYPEITEKISPLIQEMEKIWDLMIDEFYGAVCSEHCGLVGRRESPANPDFTQLPANIFDDVVEVDWIRNSARLENGEGLFSLFVISNSTPVVESTSPELKRRASVLARLAEFLNLIYDNEWPDFSQIAWKDFDRLIDKQRDKKLIELAATQSDSVEIRTIKSFDPHLTESTYRRFRRQQSDPNKKCASLRSGKVTS